MVEKIFQSALKAKRVGIFNLKETYRVLYEWLLHEGYEVYEKSYIETLQTGGTKEVDINWDAIKKYSDYFEFLIAIRFNPVKMTNVEVEVDGVKQKMNQGDFAVEFKCALIKDYDDKWDSNPFSRALRRFYDNYIVRERQEAYETKLVMEMDRLLEYTKESMLLTGKKTLSL